MKKKNWEHFQKHTKYFLKKKKITCFPSNQTQFYIHKNKEINPCNCKILTCGPLSYLFQEMKPPFIESKKSRIVKGAFPLRSNKNDKRSLN